MFSHQASGSLWLSCLGLVLWYWTQAQHAPSSNLADGFLEEAIQALHIKASWLPDGVELCVTGLMGNLPEVAKTWLLRWESKGELQWWVPKERFSCMKVLISNLAFAVLIAKTLSYCCIWELIFKVWSTGYLWKATTETLAVCLPVITSICPDHFLAISCPSNMSRWTAHPVTTLLLAKKRSPKQWLTPQSPFVKTKGLWAWAHKPNARNLIDFDWNVAILESLGWESPWKEFLSRKTSSAFGSSRGFWLAWNMTASHIQISRGAGFLESVPQMNTSFWLSWNMTAEFRSLGEEVSNCFWKL